MLLSKMKVFLFIFLIITVQFVVPGVTQTDSSPIFSSGTYNYWPNRTVDGNFSQSIRACLHTAAQTSISEAWLRIDLQTVKSMKSVKFWYRNDSKYHIKTLDDLFFIDKKIFCIKKTLINRSDIWIFPTFDQLANVW